MGQYREDVNACVSDDSFSSDEMCDGGKDACISPLRQCSDEEGWVQVIGTCLLNSSSGRCELEDDNDSNDDTVGFDGMDELVVAPGSSGEGFMWASLCTVLVLFSASASQAPHAVLDKRGVRVASADFD